MSKAERAQMYLEYLRSEGYVPSIDGDGDVVFKYEGRTYYIIVSETDPEYFKLLFPNFWSLESPEEKVKAERSALIATLETKVAKVSPVRENVVATIEMFCSPPESFKNVFPRSISALRSAVQTFVEKMKEE
jgi:hypothetical protein